MRHDPYHGYSKNEWARMTKKQRKSAETADTLKILLLGVIIIVTVFGFTGISMLLNQPGCSQENASGNLTAAQRRFNKLFDNYDSLKITTDGAFTAEAHWRGNNFDYTAAYKGSDNINDPKSLIIYYVGDIYEECSGFEHSYDGWYFKNGTVRITGSQVDIKDNSHMNKSIVFSKY